MILLENVSKTYALEGRNMVAAVAQVSLRVNTGEFVVITGRSGSGKTTLLNLVAGLARPTSGLVQVDGINLWDLNDQQQSNLRNRKFGFVFQFPSLIPSLTVTENVLLPSVFGERQGSKEAKQRALDLLEQVGLSEKRAALPRQLSAGQQQRVVIARSMMNQPEVLLADEPTSNLDEQTEAEIMELFSQLHQESGITVLLVTHSLELVAYGTRGVRMANGQVEDSQYLPEVFERIRRSNSLLIP